MTTQALRELREKVVAERKLRGLSLRDVASESGVAFSTISRMERGIGECSPDVETRLRAWLGEDVELPLSNAERFRAEEIGRAIARAASSEIRRIVLDVLIQEAEE